MPTQTTNRLHFEDLDPLRFEDLCLNLVARLRDWKELNHFGRLGSDGGVDIHAVESVAGGGVKQWFIQCKRYSKMGRVHLQEIVDKVSHAMPDKLFTIIGCDISKEHYQFYKEYTASKGIVESEIWAASTLEAMLYKDYPDLLFVYFGIRRPAGGDNAAKVKHSLRLEKKMQKDFINRPYLQANQERVLRDPSLKFRYDTVIIRSIDDVTYPSALKAPSGQISPWFKTNLYDFYHNGIELWLSASHGHKVLIDRQRGWELLKNYDDPRQENPAYQVRRVKMIGQVPYYNIVDYKLEGDEYYNDPHLFCRFSLTGMPYERIYYRIYGDPAKGTYDWELSSSQETKFSQ